MANPVLSITGSYGEKGIALWFISHTVGIMSIIFLIFIFLVLINIKSIIKSFNKIKKKSFFILLIIFLLGFWLRNSGYIYGMGFDGFFYVDTAKTLYKTNLFLKGCAIGETEDCRLYHQTLFPPGYPYLITLMFHLFGEHDILAMYISGILSSLTIILVFCITYLLFSDERKGLYTALIAALVPLDVFISSTGAVRPTSNFFIALTILFYLIALKKHSIKLWSLVAITFSYSIYVRQENAALIAPMFAGLYLFNYFRSDDFKILKNIRKNFNLNLKTFSIPILILIVTQIPVQHWVIVGKVGQGGKLFYLRNIRFTLPEVIHSLFFKNRMLQNNLFLPIASIFFTISLLFIFNKKYRKTILFVFIWFLVYLILILFYIQFGLPEGLAGDYIRHMQNLVIPYAILTAFSFSMIEEKIKFNKNIILLTIGIILISSLRPEFRFNLFEDKRLSEGNVLELVTAINKTPEDSLIMIDQSAIPSFDYFYGTNRRWIDINLINANSYLFTKEEIENKGNRPLILIGSDLCFRVEFEGCEFIHNNFDLKSLYVVDDVKIYSLTQKRSNLLIPSQ